MGKRANNEGTIYKKTVTKNGKDYSYWESQVTIGIDPGTGKRIRKTYTGKTQKAVKEKMQEAAIAVQKQDFFEPSKATLGEWIDTWLDQYCSHVKYQTKKSYQAQCNTHIKPALGAIPLAALSTPQIQSFYNMLSEKGHTISKTNKKTGKVESVQVPLSPKSIKNVHTTLSKCLNTAVKLKYIRFNPASQTSRPKVSKPNITPLENDEIKLFLQELESEEYADLYKVIVFTGMRKSEALGLSWNNINFKTHSIKINQQLQKRPIRDGGYTIAPVKQDRIRIIVVTQYVMDVLSARKEVQESDKKAAGSAWTDIKAPNGKSSQLVFTKKDGSPINPKAAYLHYNKIAKKLNVDAHRVHDLRHTYAVVSLQNGDDYKTIQENLGHASASFTLDIYGHVTTKMQRDSAARMESFIESIEGKNDAEK